MDRCLKFTVIALLTVGGLATAQAQTTNAPNDPVNVWLSQHIDPDVLRAIRGLNEQRAEVIVAQLQQAMRGTNIYQLGELHQAANELEPLLLKYRETYVYGLWLQQRLDYMDAAEQVEREARASMKPGATTQVPLPTQKWQRLAWTRQFANRPLPPAAKEYVPRLKKIFAEQGVPPELVWVAEVESAFNADARSPVGAAGMFQLMPDTARDEHLSLFPLDERYQPEKAAVAAAKYLHSLHSRYGDWELALAAYNDGPGNVDALLKKLDAHTFAGIARRLPAETQMYVPKVRAIVFKREGRELNELRSPRA